MPEIHQSVRRRNPPPGGQAVSARNQEESTTVARLPEGRVDLWHVRPDELSGERLDDCRRVLATAEAAEGDRFCFEKDRRLFVVARAMLRIALSGYLGRDPRAPIIRRNRYGKPYLAGPIPSPLQFNVSHSSGLAVCAVTVDHEIGVDVEDTEHRVAELELARQFFAPSEAVALERLPALSRRATFFRYWTLKEAYIKARGMGLSIPLQSFAFSFGGGDAPVISLAAPGADRPEDWQFAEFSLGDRHQLGLAVRCPSSKPLEIAVREMSF
jgi:4'-phosphopantetheinyl transferase